MFEPHNLVLELLNQCRRDKRESTVNVSASLFNISGAIPKFQSLASPQSTTSVVTVTKDVKLKVKSFIREVQFKSCKLNLKLESKM